jgi:enterochelin esterase-like enzyme
MKNTFLFLILLFLITGCGTPLSENVDETITPQPIAIDTPATVYTKTPEGCFETRGHFDFVEVPSVMMNYPMEARVYLPACYEVEVDRTYPVLYFIHGQSFNDDQWDRLGADEALDEIVKSGKYEPFIIVMPKETNYMNNQWDSKFGPSLAEELVPWIDNKYRTMPERSGRAIGGLSRGAAWAMRTGMIYWETFNSIGCHSFAPFRGDFNEAPFWFKVIPPEDLPRIYIDMGVLDVNLDPANVFETRLTKYRIPHEWHIFLGTHNENYWSAHVSEYLEWYSEGWNR